MISFALLLALSADPSIVYTKSFPGSTPPYVEVNLERDGAVIYKEKEDDDQPVKFSLKQEEVDAIFALADKLEHFKNPLESGLPVARMGEKTFRWVNASEKYEQKYNYSTSEDVKSLQDWFEKITETEMHLFNLEHIGRAVFVRDYGAHLWFFVSARCAGEYESESG